MPDRSTPHPDPSGNTVSKSKDGSNRPRLAHEHDESADSQDSQPRDLIKQAHDDVESGQENTDLRGSLGKREDMVPKPDSTPDRG